VDCWSCEDRDGRKKRDQDWCDVHDDVFSSTLLICTLSGIAWKKNENLTTYLYAASVTFCIRHVDANTDCFSIPANHIHALRPVQSDKFARVRPKHLTPPAISLQPLEFGTCSLK
jgi:hypothetical protein